jgi:hypothetical protein
VLARIKLADDDKEPGRSEWNKLFRAVLNNQPEIVAEWRDTTARERRRYFRDAYGPDGDQLRWAGFGTLKLGPLSRGAIDRFAVKLGKALYYLHNNKIFEGDIYIRHIDPLVKNRHPDFLEDVLQLAPEFVTPRRNTKSSGDQFAYRFNRNPELGAIYAVVQFNPQFVLLIMAVSQDLAQTLVEDAAASHEAMPDKVFHCTLKRTIGAAGEL